MRAAASIKALLWLTCLALAGCAAVSYDAEADKQLTSLSQEINLQLITWANQLEASTPTTVAYDPKFYNKAEADLTALKIRLQATQSAATDQASAVCQSLLGQVEDLRKLHEKEKAFTSAEFLRAEQQLLNSQLAALLTFELSLKPGQSTSAAKTASKPAATPPPAAGK